METSGKWGDLSELSRTGSVVVDRAHDEESASEEAERSDARVASRVCPEYQTRIEQIPLKSTVAHLPVRRCMLVERLVARLRPLPEAQSLVRTIALDPTGPIPYCVCGPDLDTIEHAKCTTERCVSSCTPSYEQMITRFGLSHDPVSECEPN